MSGFLKKLFGLGAEEGAGDGTSAKPNEVYKDVEIRAAPMPEASGQFRIAGTLSKTDGEQTISRRFIRADLVQGKDQAVAMTVEKARMIIDQQGAMLWKGDPDMPV